MSDRLEQLRSLAVGVGDLQHGQPGDEGHCTAADLIRWAVAEIERHRMTGEERGVLHDAADAFDYDNRAIQIAVVPRPHGTEGETMTCPICDNKPPNCDCTELERRQHEEIERLTAEVERLRAKLAGSPPPAGWLWLTDEDEMP